MHKQLLPRAIAVALGLGITLTASAADMKFAPGEDARLNWDSYEAFKSDVDLSGENLSIFGPWLGPDAELVKSVIAYFEAATGATVEYSGSDSFEQQVMIDAQANSSSNISVFPQPGLAANMAASGFLTPLGEDTGSWITDNYAAGSSWVDLGTYAGNDGSDALYGFFYKVDVKSLVWYVPENFEDAGYEIPNSMEELHALSDQIVADGGTPWCIGLGSGGATGWPATDWVEDFMLRTQSPAMYDKWVSNEIKFDDPAVVEAIEEFGKIARNDDYVAGGAGAVASTDFRDSPKGLFDSPPKCYMHRQASFIPSFFPEGTELGADADFFYFPAYEGKDLGKPVLGAGTLFAITNDNPAAHAFIDFLQTAYANDALRKQGQILLDATTFRFDASDLMPGKIGAGSFWTGMVDYAGGKDAAEVGKDIQTTWDSL